MVYHFKIPELIIFISVASLKLLLETLIRVKTGVKNKEIKQKLSIYFIITSLLMPLVILIEILFSSFILPLYLIILFAGIQSFLLFIRYISVKTLGEQYSVDIRFDDDKGFVKNGIYKYIRHPVYLVSILENIAYPLASSAVFSAIIFTVFITPFILLRRCIEEKLLIEKYKEKYINYIKETIF